MSRTSPPPKTLSPNLSMLENDCLKTTEGQVQVVTVGVVDIMVSGACFLGLDLFSGFIYVFITFQELKKCRWNIKDNTKCGYG